MRKASTLRGLITLTLVAVAGTARAQQPAPPPPPPAAVPPPAATAPVASPMPAPAPAPMLEMAPASAPPSERKLQLGASFLAMGLGRFTALSATDDAAFAFGVSVQAGYMVLPGLTLGIAPQAIFNVKPREDNGTASKQYDLMARIAYSLRVVDTIALYVEALPGYSIISPPSGASPKGLVLAGGVGVLIDLTDKAFANLGIGYQRGFQTRTEGVMDFDVRTRYVRVALGGGVRF